MKRAPRTAGDCICVWRVSRGYSYRDLARRTGLSAGYLCDVEKGRKALAFARVPALSRALGLDAKVLVQHLVDDLLRAARLRLDVTVYARLR